MCSLCRRALHVCLILATLATFLFAGTAAHGAGTFTAFGPKDYTRGTGDPVTVTDTFSVLNPSTQYTLKAFNGGLQNSQSELVSSTIVTLNGVQVIGANNFNQNVAEVDVPVTLQASNTLSVQVRGHPGGILTIQVVGVDTEPPSIRATVSPAPNAAGWNSTNLTVTFSCSDPTSGVASCPSARTVTMEGAEQSVSGVAADNAGNTASTTVTLNIDKTSPTISYSISPVPNASGVNTTTPVTITFTCSDALSGVASCPAPVTVTTTGMNQLFSGTATDVSGNTAPATATVNIQTQPPTPPSISASVSPVPNGNGWNNSNVTVTFTCTPGGAAITSCPGAQAVTSEGANQVLSGTAMDANGLTATINVTVNVDKTPPALSVPFPTDGTTVTNGSLTLSGTVADSLSGVEDVICSGLEAAVAGNSITCRLRLSVGSNAIQVQGIDFAGNVAMTTINVMYNLDPSPSALFLTPGHFALGMSETRTLGLVDDLGRVIPASGWAVSDATVAQVAVEGTITPVAAGTATVTGSYQGLSATAQLTVYGTPGLPPATVRWFVQPMPGNTLLKVYSGQAATPDDPNAYFVEQAASNLIVRAMTWDGRQVWAHTIQPTLGSGAKDRVKRRARPSFQKVSSGQGPSGQVGPRRWGNRITEFLNKMKAWQQQSQSLMASASHEPRLRPAAFRSSESGARLALSNGRGKARFRRVQSGSGTASITMLATAPTDAGNEVVNTFESLPFGGCTNTEDNLRVLDKNGNELWKQSVACGEMGFALHPDGIVYIVRADYADNATTLLAMDEVSGATKFSIPLPASCGGQCQPFVGLPSVLPDGNLYLPVETAADASSPDVLQLLKVAADGSHSWLPVTTATQCFGPVIDPHEAIPDAQGGVLVTWEYTGFSSSCIGYMNRVQLSYLPSFVPRAQMALPLVKLLSYFSDNDGDAVLGQQRLFVTDGTRNAVGFNLTNSTVDTTWQAPPNASSSCGFLGSPCLTLAGVTADEQLVVNQVGNADGSTTAFAVTPGTSGCGSSGCFTSTSVPNATLDGFDFLSGFFAAAELRASETLTFTGNFFCLCVLEPEAPSSLPIFGAAAVTAPAEPPEEDPPWPQEAMSQKRQASLISIKDRRRRETFSVSQRKLLRESLIARKILDRKIAQARPRPLTMQTAGF